MITIIVLSVLGGWAYMIAVMASWDYLNKIGLDPSFSILWPVFIPPIATYHELAKWRERRAERRIEAHLAEVKKLAEIEVAVAPILEAGASYLKLDRTKKYNLAEMLDPEHQDRAVERRKDVQQHNYTPGD